jgi:predicted nucleic acid-binding protein
VIVVDASAIVDFVADLGAGELQDRIASDRDLHAPHIIDVEVASALRRLAASGRVSADRAADALRDAFDLPIARYPHRALLERAWELRATVAIADGVYIALAEYLGASLLTCDARLARTTGHEATVELV